MQISIVDVDANGRALNTSTTFALCGQVRSQGESDDSINRLATKAGCKFLRTLCGGVVAELLWSSAPERMVVPKMIVVVTVFVPSCTNIAYLLSLE